MKRIITKKNLILSSPVLTPTLISLTFSLFLKNEIKAASEETPSSGARWTQILPTKLVSRKNLENRPLDPRNPGARYLYPKNHSLSISPKKFGLCLAAVTRQHYRVSSFLQTQMLCREHDYNFDIKTKRKKNLKYLSKPEWPLLIDYLVGNFRKCDYVTGHEAELEEWVLNQLDNTISPYMLYEQSLILNDGYIWNALLTNYELLRNYARYWDSPRYTFDTNVHKAEAFYNKFIDIRGDLDEREDGNYTGDHAGSWYRIWGAMLYRLDQFDVTEITQAVDQGFDLSLSSKLASIANDLWGLSTYAGDEYILKPFYGVPERDDRKVSISNSTSRSVSWLVQGLAVPEKIEKADLSYTGCYGNPYLY